MVSLSQRGPRCKGESIAMKNSVDGGDELVGREFRTRPFVFVVVMVPLAAFAMTACVMLPTMMRDAISISWDPLTRYALGWVFVTPLAVLLMRGVIHAFAFYMVSGVSIRKLKVGLLLTRCTTAVSVRRYRFARLLPTVILVPLAVVSVAMRPSHWMGTLAGFVFIACIADVWLVTMSFRIGKSPYIADVASGLGLVIAPAAVPRK